MVSCIPMILTGVLLNAFARVLLKKGMLGIGYFEFNFQTFIPIIKKVTIRTFYQDWLPMGSVLQSGGWPSPA